MLTIYHAPRSRSNRVIWLCEEMGVPYDVVSLKLGEKPPGLLAVNAGATIPLMTDGEVVLFESITMLEYITETYGPTDLVLGAVHPNHWDYRQMLLWGEATLAGPINFVVGTAFRGPADQKDNYTVEMIRETFARRTGVVSQRLAKGPYMAGDTFTLADISVVYGLALAKSAEALGLRPFLTEDVLDYLSRVTQRPAYQRMIQVR